MRIRQQELEDILGADNVSFDEETCRIYSNDAANLPDLAGQIIDKQFDLVVQPVNVDSLQKLVRIARKNKEPLVPRGNGTSGWGGAIPSKRGICVSMGQMKSILHMDDYSCTVTVESGITWRELLMALQRLGMTVPIYPTSATAATIAGFVASGGLGIGSAKHGNIIDQVVGLEAVLPNGKLVRAGKLELGPRDDPLAPQAKEGTEWLESILEGTNIGIMSLLAGTYGVFGIITKATLRLIPRLQLQPFGCTFPGMQELVDAAHEIVDKTLPYHLRFLDSNHTSKLSSLIGFPNEWGRFVLVGALHGTIYDNEDGLEEIGRIVLEKGGSLLDTKRADFYWSERLYPLRFKRQGPSLVPAEVLVPLENVPELHTETLSILRKSNIAVEGTVGPDGSTSYLVWILDDERKKLGYTIGWHRSFDIAAIARKYGGRPYAVALWNTRHAKEFYGEEAFRELAIAKRLIDPDNVMNPMKVFGGRVQAAWQSQFFGFSIGLSGAYAVLAIGALVPGLTWLSASNSWIPFPMIPLPFIVYASLLAGIAGIGVIRLMTLKLALSIGIPLLRVLGRFFGK